LAPRRGINGSNRAQSSLVNTGIRLTTDTLPDRTRQGYKTRPSQRLMAFRTAAPR
jgi:hypothetical protein